MRNSVIFFCVVLLLSCQPSKNTPAVVGVPDHPAWIMQGNIYEVNVRQYTPEGTFNAFAKHLDRLKAMGVQTLWFMPINPISIKDRKGSLGSYYAVSNYTTVNPEFGTLNDWNQLVKAAHEKGMKVIIDWVPNHTGADHPWLEKHPDFYAKDKNGNPAVMMDWTDTRLLNYSNPVLEDSMIASMEYWIRTSSIDGFRCDVAWNVPGSFWSKCISQLKQINKDIFMLAEGDKPYLHTSGFDATYPWEMFHTLEKIANAERPAYAIDSLINKFDTAYTATAIEMYFTSNHDENSWNKADYCSFPGAVHAPFAVLTQTLAHSVPLIYGGQEEPVLRAIKFFDKDTMWFEKFERASFYKTLLDLRSRNAALSADASFRKIDVGNRDALYAFVREKNGKKVLVILNLSNNDQTFSVKDESLHGHALNVFNLKKEEISTTPTVLAKWGFWVYEY
ncbi:MAG: alpha-amylase [Bacteroidetes bacterium]|nr:alpha-amylase [Bacteroidota bacterium]